MMRAWNRPHEPILASTYQYAAQHLLYRADDVWPFIPPTKLAHHIKRLLPAPLHRGWESITRGRAETQEAEAINVAKFIAANGARLGFRTPDAEERTRALGIQEYVRSLRLSEYDTFNATGNAFDRDACYCRIFHPLREWAADHNTAPQHNFLHPAELMNAYNDLAQVAAKQPTFNPANQHTMESPFPRDLQQHLLQGHFGPCDHQPPHRAAPGGRADQ